MKDRICVVAANRYASQSYRLIMNFKKPRLEFERVVL